MNQTFNYALRVSKILTLLLINKIVFSLILIILVIFYTKLSVEKYLQLQDSKHYIAINAISIKQIADKEMQSDFDQFIYDCALVINDKNVQYSSFPEKDDVMVGNYTLSLNGRYLPFLKYLNSINNKKILYKINSLHLKNLQDRGITIKINLEALYEV